MIMMMMMMMMMMTQPGRGVSGGFVTMKSHNDAFDLVTMKSHNAFYDISSKSSVLNLLHVL